MVASGRARDKAAYNLYQIKAHWWPFCWYHGVLLNQYAQVDSVQFSIARGHMSVQFLGILTNTRTEKLIHCSSDHNNNNNNNNNNKYF